MDPWNKLTHIFSDPGGIDRVPPGCADNILIAWPSMLHMIQEAFKELRGLKALDIGCGAGYFCNKLRSLGLEVTGVDTSEAMINIAGQHLPQDITLIAGGLDSIQSAEAYELVTAVMVFQFIEDIEGMLTRVDYVLKPFGLLVFAVFNPLFVASRIDKGSIFKDFDSTEKPRRGIMELSEGVRIPVFTRSAAEYTKLLENMGYQRTALDCPPFTEDFCENYPMDYPSVDPEFLILGFRKMTFGNIVSARERNYFI